MHWKLPLVMMMGLSAVIAAQERKPAGGAKAKAVKSRASADALVTPSREAAALAFVEQHHPELTGVLNGLKSMEKDKYDEAIADIFAASERLAQLQARDETRHELALEEWKTRSRIELLAARMTRQKSPAMTDELESLLRKQLELRVRQQKLERQRLTNRLQRIESQIQRLEKDQDRIVKAQLRRLLPAKAAKPRSERPKADRKAADRKATKKD